MLVTAIMPTGRLPGRRALSDVAIECFFQQTYRDRQLLILNHSDDPFRLNDPRVKELMVKRPPTLGELRNIGLEAADGDLLITWDDDDWHSPRRMEVQVEAWRTTGKAVVLTCYTTCDLQTGEAFVRGCQYYRGGGCCGTILFPRTRHRYPSLDRHEDGGFVTGFCQDGMLHAMDNWQDPLLYVRTCHGANTWSREFIFERARRGSRSLTADEQSTLITVLDDFVRHHAIALNPIAKAVKQW